MGRNFTVFAIYVGIVLVFSSNGASGKDENRHANKTYVITTVLSEPYVMYKNKSLGNSTQPKDAELTGMFVDILGAIAHDVGFKYRIQLAADGRYGSQYAPGQWSGMIGELMNKTADMAMGDLTIAANRAKVVTFSQPMLDAGLRILFTKPTPWVKLENSFLLMTPFTKGLWIMLIVVFVVVSVFLYVLARFSPLERDTKTDRPPTAFSVDKCFLYTFKALTWQGMGVMPKSFSVRVLSATWWSVCLIVVACYIANLTALFLTKEPITRFTPFLTFEELSRQTEVDYGTVEGGSSARYFKYSERPVEKRMWDFMKNRKPSVFTKNYMEGLERVRNSRGSYAFIAESTFVEYQVNQLPCDLIALGQPLSDRAYGFACSKENDDLCKDIDEHILMMKEHDTMHMLKNKWFSGPCSADQKEELFFQGNLFFDSFMKSDLTMEKAVTLGRMMSVWVIFLVGSFLSFVVLGIELCLRGRRLKNAKKLDTADDQQRIEEFYDE